MKRAGNVPAQLLLARTRNRVLSPCDPLPATMCPGEMSVQCAPNLRSERIARRGGQRSTADPTWFLRREKGGRSSSPARTIVSSPPAILSPCNRFSGRELLSPLVVWLEAMGQASPLPVFSGERINIRSYLVFGKKHEQSLKIWLVNGYMRYNVLSYQKVGSIARFSSAGFSTLKRAGKEYTPYRH